MGLLHYEDYVCPLHQLWRQRIVGIVISARRAALDSRVVSKHLLGRWASEPILTAYEEDSHLHFPRSRPFMAAHDAAPTTISVQASRWN